MADQRIILIEDNMNKLVFCALWLTIELDIKRHLESLKLARPARQRPLFPVDDESFGLLDSVDCDAWTGPWRKILDGRIGDFHRRREIGTLDGYPGYDPVRADRRGN